MKSVWLVAIPVVLALPASYALSACSSSTADVGDASVPDSSTTDARTGTGSDSSIPPENDASPPADSGGPDTSCTAAADCPGEVCCGTIPVTGGNVPNCTTGTLTTACKAASSCATKLGTSCSGTQTVRLCTTNTDCTESGDSSCCTFTDGDGGSLSFCANAFVGAFGGGKCQ